MYSYYVLQLFHSYTPSQKRGNRYLSTTVITALFPIAKTCKQTKCPSVDERIDKMWLIHTVEWYLVTRMEWSFNSQHMNTHTQQLCRGNECYLSYRLIVVSFHNVYVNQNIKLYSLNIHTTFIHQRYLNNVVLKRLHLMMEIIRGRWR